MRYYLTFFLLTVFPAIRAQSILSTTQWKLEGKNDEIHFTPDSIRIYTENIVTGTYSYSLSDGRLRTKRHSPERSGGFQLPARAAARLAGNGETLLLFPVDRKDGSSATITLRAKRAVNLPQYDWSYRSLRRDSVAGCSYYDACALLANTPGQPVIVGVIDTGIDQTHSQLKQSIWTNSKEKPGNRLDDDKNGYVDDMHGWYWTALSDGTFMTTDLSEAIRVLQGDSLGNTNPGVAEQARRIYQRESEKLALLKMAVSDTARLKRTLASLATYAGDGAVTLTTLQGLPVGSDSVQKGVRLLTIESYRGRPTNWAQLSARLTDFAPRLHAAYKEMTAYAFNRDYQPLTDGVRFAGQGEGPVLNRADVLGHGTYVAGILTAPLSVTVEKAEGSYMSIMDLAAAPPTGDERDELLAKAICYAVDNGASVINISVAKKLSAHRSLVDAALLHALKKDVLVINCAGNDSNDNDETPYFPVGPVNLPGNVIGDNFIEVGNSSTEWNEKLPFYSSNYGRSSVDLFAPGVQIRTTAPGQQYATISGTSLSAPLVARVAALIRSHFPNLTAGTVKAILMESVRKPVFSVLKPGTAQLVAMRELCSSGGILDAEAAVRLAMSRSAQVK